MTDDPAPRLKRHVPPPRAAWPRVVLGATLVIGALGAAGFFAIRSTYRGDDWAGAFVDFPVGTTWTYKVRAEGQEGVSVAAVVRQEGGRTTIERRGPEDELRVSVWYAANGYVCEAVVVDGVARPPERIYRIGAIRGHGWLVREEDPAYTTKYLGLADTVVPAGKFRNCINVRLVLKTAVQDSCFAPGVGLVRVEHVVLPDPVLHIHGGRIYLMELVEFKRGK